MAGVEVTFLAFMAKLLGNDVIMVFDGVSAYHGDIKIASENRWKYTLIIMWCV